MNLKEEQMKLTGSIEEHEAKLIKTNKNLFSPGLGPLNEVRKIGRKLWVGWKVKERKEQSSPVCQIRLPAENLTLMHVIKLFNLQA